MSAHPPSPAARYPHRGAPLRLGPRSRIAALVLLLAATLGVAMLAWRTSDRAAHWTNLGFVVDSPAQITARYEITKREGQAVICRAEALNARHSVVGVADFEVPGNTGRSTRGSVKVATQEKAVTATIKDCRYTT